MAGPRDQRWWTLPSGAVYFGTRKPGASPCRNPSAGDPTPQQTADDLAALVAQVNTAVEEGDRQLSDRLIRHAVHEGTSPTDVVLAFANQGVQPSQRGGTVGTDVAGGDLPADPPQVTDGPIGDGRPPVDDQADSGSDVAGQTRKPRRRNDRGS